MSAPNPHLEMAELPLSQSISSTPAQAVGAAALQIVLADIVNGQLPSIVALTMRATTCRLWRLIDIEPVDDVVRALSRREDAEAVVVVGPTPMPPGLEGDRCVVVAAECAAGGFNHLVVFKTGPEGELFRIGGRSSDGEAPFRWFGVPPAGQVDLWVEGIVGMTAAGPRGPGKHRGST